MFILFKTEILAHSTEILKLFLRLLETKLSKILLYSPNSEISKNGFSYGC